MKSSDVKAMLDEYNNGGDFADFVNRNAKAYGTDAIAEIHKAITFEYFKWLKEFNKGKIKDQ